MPVIDLFKAVASQLIVLHHLAFYGPMSDAAAPLVAGLLRDDPRSADGRILRVLQEIARGDVERAKPLLDAIGSATPRVEALAQRLAEVRSRLATPG